MYTQGETFNTMTMSVKIKWLVTVGGIALITGCGAPDLTSLKPMKSKNVVEVIMVDNPTQWVDSDIQNRLASSHVALNVRQVTSSQLLGALTNSVSSLPNCLYIVASNQPFTSDVADFAANHVGTRFTFVSPLGTTSGMQGSLNVRQITQDPGAVGYTLGSLVGNIAVQNNIASIGWVTDGHSTVSTREIQDALAGMYSADANVQVTPLTLAKAQVGSLPQYIVTGRPLTTAEQTLLSQNGSIIISLCPQPVGPSFAAWPVIPDTSVVSTDVSDLIGNKWSSGSRVTDDGPFIYQNNTLVPASVQSTMSNLESSLIVNPKMGDLAWQAIPSQIQTTWGQIVQTGY